MFALSDKQKKIVDDWYNKHPCKTRYSGAIGGSLTYRLTPTSIGVVLVVQCTFPDCKEEIDVSMYDEW